MGKIDLKPLNKETVQKMGIENHDLWVVKAGEMIYGPFETESLKHYASENESLFDKAFASRLENNDWQPFFSHAIFQRRHPQVVTKFDDSTYEGPFWIMGQGIKSPPKSKEDIFKMIEMGLLTMTDLISCDDGVHWKKVHQLKVFDRRGHKPSDLPVSPQENSFQKARIDLIEQEENSPEVEEVRPEESVASLAYLGQGKTNTSIKIDEITLDAVQETEVSRSLKWAIPSALLGCITLVAAGMYVFSPSQDMEEIVDTEEVPKVRKLKPRAQLPKPAGVRRAPANTRSLLDPGRDPVNRPPIHHSQFPTHIETHHYDTLQPEPEPEPEQLERDPANEPQMEYGQEHGQEETDRHPAQTQEHSLINNQNNQNDQQNQDMSLNEAMNVDNVQPPEPQEPQEQQPIEEVSDF